MRLTRSVEYSLRAVIYMAGNPGRTVRLEEIALAQNIPPSSLSPVLRWLACRGIIQSQAGYRGGYRMNKDPNRVNLRQLIETVEGPIFHDNCLIHEASCASATDHWCPIHDVWEEAKKKFLSVLERCSAQELASCMVRWNTVDEMLKDLIMEKSKESAKS